jgi:hypothetical protein
MRWILPLITSKNGENLSTVFYYTCCDWSGAERKSDMILPRIHVTGTQLWLKNNTDEYHRINSFAIINIGGDQWWQNEQRHRVGGPAVIRADGHQQWWQKDKLHRVGGPAIVFPDGTKLGT